MSTSMGPSSTGVQLKCIAFHFGNVFLTTLTIYSDCTVLIFKTLPYTFLTKKILSHIRHTCLYLSKLDSFSQFALTRIIASIIAALGSTTYISLVWRTVVAFNFGAAVLVPCSDNPDNHYPEEQCFTCSLDTIVPDDPYLVKGSAVQFGAIVETNNSVWSEYRNVTFTVSHHQFPQS